MFSPGSTVTLVTTPRDCDVIAVARMTAAANPVRIRTVRIETSTGGVVHIACLLAPASLDAGTGTNVACFTNDR
jgi:hypothetical protein